MSLRIVREKLYVPLPIGVDSVLDLYGKQSSSIPLEDVHLPEDYLPLLHLGVMERCLVVVENNLSSSELEDAVSKFNECHDGKEMLTVELAEYLDKCVVLSSRYKLRTSGEDCWIDMDNLKYLDFVLCWHKGRFLPSRNRRRLDAIKTLLAATGIARHENEEEDI